MIRTLIAASALAAALMSPTASAQNEAVEEKNLLSGKAKIDPASGYIFLSGPARQWIELLRLPDAEAIAEYEKDWAKAFAQVRADYPGKLKNWEVHLLAAHRQGRKPREKPIEPTAENFAIGPIEARQPVFIGPQFVFSKSDTSDSVSYLMKVKPGRYVVYRQLSAPNNGLIGMCFCMGTIAFEVKPGVITDLGDFFFAGPGGDPAFPARPDKMQGSEAGLYRPASKAGTLTFGLPPSLRDYPTAPADLRAYGKLDNFYGITVGRMPPVAGVLAYDRDKVIDLKAKAEEAVAPPLEAAATGAGN
ncbi:hypothetical protein [Sphingopyxis sp. KK2]|uniref:hypothetical protein n=1 Tax=Sphingopyxis sp. KK2 TaxID=1855727 RepID=UPI00097E5FA4|nr:hypothetical protein [Sphingopyxis sp. KK2]